METIKYILSFLVKLAFTLIVASLLVWIFPIIIPSFNFGNIFSSKETSSSATKWSLPSPGSFQTNVLKEPKTPSATDNVFVYDSNQPSGYSYSQTDYVTYTDTGEPQTIKTSQNPSPNLSSYVRNLSIYEGENIYTNFSFYGEAKNTMFQNNVFPVLILDNKGKIVYSTNAQALAVGSTPDWVKFGVRITSALPQAMPCTIIFQSNNSKNNAAGEMVRVGFPVLCK